MGTDDWKSLSGVEILELAQTLLQTSTDSTLDLALYDAYMDELERRAPTPPPLYDQPTAWKRVLEAFEKQEAEQRRRAGKEEAEPSG